MAQRSQRIELLGMASTATPAEAAAIVAALERFVRDTARPGQSPATAVDPWQRAALLEGVSRESDPDVPDSWINA